MMKKQLFPLLILASILFAGCSTMQPQSSTNQNGTIVIDATGEVMAPANEIIFNININQFDSVASEAFSKHKEQEEFLTRLILDQNIDEDHINAHPISISPRRHSQNQGFETRQNVTMRLQDLNQFEQMQITLIENGFDNFSANFSTKNAEEARSNALGKAVEVARNKAEKLANGSGRQLGKVVNIEYTSSFGFVQRSANMMVEMEYDESLLEMQKTIPVRENVRITFALQ